MSAALIRWPWSTITWPDLSVSTTVVTLAIAASLACWVSVSLYVELATTSGVTRAAISSWSDSLKPTGICAMTRFGPFVASRISCCCSIARRSSCAAPSTTVQREGSSATRVAFVSEERPGSAVWSSVLQDLRRLARKESLVDRDQRVSATPRSGCARCRPRAAACSRTARTAAAAASWAAWVSTGILDDGVSRRSNGSLRDRARREPRVGGREVRGDAGCQTHHQKQRRRQ